MESGKAEVVGFENEISNIQIAIADFESGRKLNVAIIAEPFGGRSTLVNEIAKMNTQKITRLYFLSVVKNKDEISMPEQSKRIIIIDDCQLLYMRKIGGFNILKDFLKSVTSSDKMFITAWNLYSWKYLDAVMGIGRFFPVQINLPRFTTDEVKGFILSMYEPDEIKFTEDTESKKEKIIEIVQYPVTIRRLKKSISVPSFKLHSGILKIRLFKKEVLVEDIVFEKINSIAHGNPGVAKVVWLRSLEYPVIKPGKIKELSLDIELDYNESFILSLILSIGYVEKEELAEIAGPRHHIDEILFRLVKQGLITIEKGRCSIKPEALRSVVEFLKKSRLVW